MTFDEVLSRCLEGEIKTRLCQNFLLQFLLRNCQQILDQPDMKAMRRATITLWKLIWNYALPVLLLEIRFVVYLMGLF